MTNNTLQALVEEEAQQIILEQEVCLNILIPAIHILLSRIEEGVMVVVAAMEGRQEVGIIRTRIIKNTIQVTEAKHIIFLISQHHMTLISIMIQVAPANGEDQIIETEQNRDMAEEEEDHQEDTIQEEEEEEEDKEEVRTKDMEWKYNKDVRKIQIEFISLIVCILDTFDTNRGGGSGFFRGKPFHHASGGGISSGRGGGRGGASGGRGGYHPDKNLKFIA